MEDWEVLGVHGVKFPNNQYKYQEKNREKKVYTRAGGGLFLLRLSAMLF